MSVDLSRLSDTSGALARAEAERARLIADRDRLVVEALAAGETWAAVRRASGLSLRGVQLAIRRHNASQMQEPPVPDPAQGNRARGFTQDAARRVSAEDRTHDTTG